MDKREPSLAPEWLRTSSNGSGSGLSSTNLLSSSSHSDSSSLSHNSKNRNIRSRNDGDLGRSLLLDRSSSINTRRGTSNGSARHPYSSFNYNRSHRDNKDRNIREKDRSSYMEPWELDTPFPLDTFSIGRDQDQLRRSHSMITRRPGSDYRPQGLLGNGRSINIYDGEGAFPITFPVKSPKKTVFDKDFPSLRTGEMNGGPEIARISSPVLSPVVNSLPVGNSAGEGWTSALAEVPNVIEKTVDASSHVSTSSVTSTGMTCRNMAEALVQAPARTGTPPQETAKEDREIRQSRQLIPVLPSAAKSSVLNSSDKSKIKPAARIGKTVHAPSRNPQQHSTTLLGSTQPTSSSQIKSDATTGTKLVVLKPSRENGGATVKESGTSNGIPDANQLTAAPSTQASASVRSANSPKGASVNMLAGKPVEKKPSLAQTQSRNAFFSALKQKTTSNVSTDQTKASSSVEEKANKSTTELVVIASDPSSSVMSVERTEIVPPQRNNGFELADRPDEKEAEFLRSLGWEENNSEEDEAITEEEIEAFIEQCEKLNPSLIEKLRMAQKAT